MLSFNKVEYQGWSNCYRLANDVIDLIVTADVGPRVIRFGFVGEENEFWEHVPDLGQTGGSEWRPFGGHRLWHAPEDRLRTYYPDNQPVEVTWEAEKATFTQPTEMTTGIQKEIVLQIAPQEACVRLIHRLYNRGQWPVELAPWALSMMAPGGTAVLPLPPSGVHPRDLRPTRPIVLWSYTDMTDPRWFWGKEFIFLHSVPSAANAQKIGIWDSLGWVGYAHNGHLFVDVFQPISGATYPDFHSSVELFTDHQFLEVETLGPLARVEPGAFVDHEETWYLFPNIAQPKSEEDVKKHILPLTGQFNL